MNIIHKKTIELLSHKFVVGTHAHRVGTHARHVGKCDTDKYIFQ